MLNRQRLLLALLERAGPSIQHTLLVKLAFLLREETPIGKDKTFYGFVPYRQGPFSFGLYRELQSLKRNGYVEWGETHFSLNPKITNLSADQIERLTPGQLEAVSQVVLHYGDQNRAALLRDIYRRYPWYAINSELEQYLPDSLPKAPSREVAVYTVGYEGKSVDDFFNELVQSGMTGILDVRANPVSRKYGFARQSMSRIAQSLGLSYRHLPELGIPSRQRADLTDYESYQRLLDEYEDAMLPEQSAGVAEAATLLKSKPAALLCVERDVRCCHRGRLAKRIALESGLAIEHL